MAGFKLVRDDRNKGAEALTISSIAVAVGDLLEFVIGEAATWTLCTTGSTNTSRKAIATQTVTSAAVEVQGIILDGNELVEVPTANNSAVADNGNAMILGTATTGAMTVNNTGTTVAVTETEQVFVQLKPLGAAADKRILGFVQVGNGVLQSAST